MNINKKEGNTEEMSLDIKKEDRQQMKADFFYSTTKTNRWSKMKGQT